MTHQHPKELFPGTGSCVIAGMGKTGFSCARYLARHGVPVEAVDSRKTPPMLEAFRTQLPQVPVHTGGFAAEFFPSLAGVVLSPGIAPQDEALAGSLPAGVRLSNDVDIFCRVRERGRPLVAVTGTNAKSTVVSLLAQLARRAGWRVGLGGNIGTPALDLLEEDDYECYILEMSSFQLELVSAVNAHTAALLNLSEDHLDRHGDMANYARIKGRVYTGCSWAVYNRADPATQPPRQEAAEYSSFGLDAAPKGAFGLCRKKNRQWLSRGRQTLMPVEELALRGRHNLENALAALALGQTLQLPIDAMLEGLREFAGLPHRCHFLGRIAGVDCYDDSKATNVGAACAALRGVAALCSGRVVLIAGGQGKGAQFAPLAEALAECGRAALLIGADAAQIATALEGIVPVERHATLEEAVRGGLAQARPGDALLLSPACASLDMFKDFAERGELFARALRRQAAGEENPSPPPRGGCDEEARSCYA